MGLEVEPFQRAERPDAGVVHQNVELAEPLHGGGHGSVPVVLPGHVELLVEGIRPQLGGQLLAQHVPQVGDGHLGPLGDESAGLRLALAPSAARNERHLAFKSSGHSLRPLSI